MSDEKTYRSYGVTKLDDNYRISLNIKWLGQIIVELLSLCWATYVLKIALEN